MYYLLMLQKQRCCSDAWFTHSNHSFEEFNSTKKVNKNRKTINYIKRLEILLKK